MKPNFKYAVIHRHCERYSIKEMCCFFEVSRSGYYKYLKHIEHPPNDFKLAIKSVKTKSRLELQLHSDQGFQYTSKAYFNLTKEYGITPSMSRRGNCYDNALSENFFGILKAECIYRHKPETFEEANKMIDDSIYFYNPERIQLKTGLPPLSLRQSC